MKIACFGLEVSLSDNVSCWPSTCVTCDVIKHGMIIENESFNVHYLKCSVQTLTLQQNAILSKFQTLNDYFRPGHPSKSMAIQY